MKEYLVDMDVTISVRIWVSANNEDAATKKALDMVEQEPYYHIQRGAFVNAVVVDTFEEND